MSDAPHSPRMVPAGDKPEPGPKRIYDVASVLPVESGHAIQLDGRNVRTPARHNLVVPHAAMAEAIVDEWMVQGEHVDHHSMPVTRFANTAIDNVRGREVAVVDEIIAFAGNDLLCYRAETPDGLVTAQCDAWDSVITWAEAFFGARFVIAKGVIHVPQPDVTLEAIRSELARCDAFELTALHNMTTLSGSALLAFAVARGHLDAVNGWCSAHVDEDWQISNWGPDEEAAARYAARQSEFMSACRFLTLHNTL